MELRDASLDDKYADTAKPCLISGPQALVRLLITQRRRDAAAGLNTAGFVSGYRGSPLGYVDQALWEAESWLKDNHIVFQPGINEDLAATAIWGTQQLGVAKDATVDGVFAIWYGKGPGVDRAGDPLKHGNVTGSHPNGGVLVLLGDDHPGKSSTTAHHSEQAMVAHQMPVLYPSNVGEIVRFGLLGWALSRYAGCWTAFKCVNETIEQTATVAGEEDFAIVTPPYGELPPEGVHYRGVYAPARDEQIHKRWRVPLMRRFWRANRGDRAEFGTPRLRLGLVTAGKAYGDVVQALRHLGIDAARAAQLGLDVYKVGMIWPLEPEGLREFAHGCEELFFIEEKSAFMEPQAAALFYNDAQRPRIVGKTDETGAHLLPSDLQLDAMGVALAIAARLAHLGIDDAGIVQRVAALDALRGALQPVADASPKRGPFFCSGCPHNTSTDVPEGSLAIAGIGCHGMAMWAKPNTLLGTQMGGEGATWAALQHFTQRRHMFQNIGDGTYYHSGLLAIRQAIAAKANITYKILFNDAIAMTGGQPVEGPLTPAMIAAQLLAEGARRVAVVAEDPAALDAAAFPPGVAIYPRAQLDAVQRELREVEGCSALIYVQTCAAEKRRRRKRKLIPDPDVRMVINAAVCEGCGDCSAQSNCVSIEPLETPLGRKRRINQSSCNKDYSCAKGFCPSFVSVAGVQMRKPRRASVDASVFAALPRPASPDALPGGTGIMLAGIGGTGVVTVGAVLAMAAHLQGMQASVYDMTGMSQKNGAVLSHLRIAPGDARIAAQTVGLGEANLLIAFDMVAAISDEAFRTLSAGTRLLGNDRVQVTSSFTRNPDERIDTGFIRRKIETRVGVGNIAQVDANGIALALCGDAIATNFFMVGAALQKGWLPLSVEAIERAVQLNGVQVEFNLAAIRLGRLWAHDAAAIAALLGEGGGASPPATQAQTLDELVADRAHRLTQYQDVAYAARYTAAIARLRQAEQRALPGQSALSETAARVLHSLMAYKDEYEVARLHSDPAFHAWIASQFEGTPTLRFHLAPPLFARRDARTGQLIKKQYGPWMLGVFKLLARLKRLRGGAFDLFGHTQERRAERARIVAYEALLERIAARLDAHNYRVAVELAAAAGKVRGFGHVKDAAAAAAATEEARLLAAFEAGARRAA